MSILDQSIIIRKLLKLQSSLVPEPWLAEDCVPKTVLEQLNRLCSDPDKARAMGSHFCEILRHANARRPSSNRSLENQVADWIDQTLPSGLFCSTVSASPGEPPDAYAKRVRRSLHDIAKSLGIHLRYVLVAAWQPGMHRSHAHFIVDVPNTANGAYGLVSMSIYMLDYLPDGEVALYPHVPHGGDAKYLVDHLRSKRGMEEFTTNVACPGVHDECRGPCVVKRDDPQFADATRNRRDHIPVPVVGVISDGKFRPSGRGMNKKTTKRRKLKARGERERRQFVASMERESRSQSRRRGSAASAAAIAEGGAAAVTRAEPIRRRRRSVPEPTSADLAPGSSTVSAVEVHGLDPAEANAFAAATSRKASKKSVPTTTRLRHPLTPPEW